MVRLLASVEICQCGTTKSNGRSIVQREKTKRTFFYARPFVH